MSLAVTIAIVVVAIGAAVGGWFLWRTRLQFCPHCGWIVQRVQRGWLRCPRCHKQYAHHPRLRPH